MALKPNERGMDIHQSFETLSSVFDALDDDDVDLRRFHVKERDLVSDGDMVADVEIGFSIPAAIESGALKPAAVDRIGSDAVSIEIGPITDVLPRICRDHPVDVTDVRLEGATTMILELALRLPVDSSDVIDRSTDQDPARARSTRFDAYRDDSVPPFDDTAYLQAIYDAFETFDEMRAVIDLDVTTETVRRYMIDAGIHEPNSYRTGSTVSNTPDYPEDEAQVDDEDESDEDVTVLLADGIGIPDEINIEEFIATVRRSKTLYEVQQSMDLGREQAQEILEDLNLLDLVVGRLAMESERDVTREEVIDRLRQSVA